jgi:two-component system, NtrC family, nitrogen regulation sensor histidine kinase NtrY
VERAALILVTLVALVVVWLGRRARLAAERRAETAEEGHTLLRGAVDASPNAILILSDNGRIVLSNEAAKQLFAEGGQLEGENFLALLGKAPPELREAMVAEGAALFTVGGAEGDEGETYLLTRRDVQLGRAQHTVVQVANVTRAIRRKEVEVWKRLLRTISHELNNSLAPISSLVHSARLIADKPAQASKLTLVFDTIEDRTKHLTEFLEGYAKFARLPKPRLSEVRWADFLARVKELCPFVTLEGSPPKDGWFDRAQLEQVVLNLLKNARESGSPEDAIALAVEDRGKGAFELRVADRGPGMSDEVLASALLPFYSTKERGTGIGLALSREIVDAHGGKIRLTNREGGGLVVTCALPGREHPAIPPTSRLTLTHA